MMMSWVTKQHLKNGCVNQRVILIENLVNLNDVCVMFTNYIGMMMVIFGLKGGLVSILPNIFPIVFVLGIMGYCNFHLNPASATIAAIAIGLVVDDTIHYFFHFRHEYRISGDRQLSMINALQKVGRAMCITSITLILGFLIFISSETTILMDFGLLVSIAIITALFGDLFIGSVLLTKLKVFKTDTSYHNGETSENKG